MISSTRCTQRFSWDSRVACVDRVWEVICSLMYCGSQAPTSWARAVTHTGQRGNQNEKPHRSVFVCLGLLFGCMGCGCGVYAIQPRSAVRKAHRGTLHCQCLRLSRSERGAGTPVEPRPRRYEELRGDDV